MAEAICVASTRDRPCRSYHRINARFDNGSGGLLFWLSEKDALKYFGMYKLVLRVGTDLF